MCSKWNTWTNHFPSIKFLTNQIKESYIFLSIVFFFYPTNQTDSKLVTKQWGIIIELWRWEAADSVETLDVGLQICWRAENEEYEYPFLLRVRAYK